MEQPNDVFCRRVINKSNHCHACCFVLLRSFLSSASCFYFSCPLLYLSFFFYFNAQLQTFVVTVSRFPRSSTLPYFRLRAQLQVLSVWQAVCRPACRQSCVNCSWLALYPVRYQRWCMGQVLANLQREQLGSVALPQSCGTPSTRLSLCRTRVRKASMEVFRTHLWVCGTRSWSAVYSLASSFLSNILWQEIRLPGPWQLLWASSSSTY